MGHDLMSPHVMLHDEPLIFVVNGDNKRKTLSTDQALQNRSTTAEEEFLFYMSQLLDTSRRNSSLGLLSPSTTGDKSPTASRRLSATMENVISHAIQQSNSIMPSKFSANRFEITRSGKRVAVIMLARPAYRLGDVIPIVVDLQESQIQCFSLRVTLETSEYIDPTIALRSPASILRISRRIYATQHESTISANRIFFNLAVPGTSTPEFITSGVSLEWRLRFEFGTSNQAYHGEDTHASTPDSLEEVAEDERGTVSVAVEVMPCETFEVTLPLHVYGSISEFDDNLVQGQKWFNIG
ncbi:MAG: hypothetical protein Q9166_001368 [cf. Caloplaca sp. 2 TL-2023]